MSQQAAVTLNTVAYSPAGVENNVATWINRAASFYKGFKTLTQKFLDPSNGGTQTKMTFSLDIPVVATVDGANYRAGDLLRVNSAVVSIWVNGNSTSAERTDLQLSLKDLVDTTMFKNAVINLDPAFG